MNIQCVLASVLLTALLFAGLNAEAQDKPKPYRQDRFVVGFWGDPPVDNRVKARYAEVAEANFNIVLGGVGADTPNRAKKQRDACEKYGLKVIFSTYGLPVDQLCNCETTYGFLIRDHPSVDEFDAVLQRAEEVRRIRPGKLPFINLLPNDASPEAMGVDAYETYVRRFAAAVQPEVLCFDHYPSFGPEEDGRTAYCENLATMREIALEQGVPYWNFFKAMAHGSDAAPTEAQIRWQIYASVAYGAKGVLYSCYFPPPSGNGFRGSALLDRNGKRTPRYDQARRINEELKNLGPVLLPLSSTGVFRVVPGQTPPEGVMAAVSAVEDQPKPDLLVGAFRHADGRRAVLIMNYSVTGDAVAFTIDFAAPDENVGEVSKRTGKTEPVQDERADEDGIQVVLAPGDGRLFLEKTL